MAEGHYSDFPREHLQLSSLGVGSFGGEPSPAVDARISAVVARALTHGINVIDTGAHYRYGRSLASVGAGVRTALEAGVPREAMFLVSKGGFLTLRGGPPPTWPSGSRTRSPPRGWAAASNWPRAPTCSPPNT